MAKKSVKHARSMSKADRLKARQAVIDWKRKSPDVTLVKMAEKMGLSKATIRYWIETARNRGELTPDSVFESAVKASAVKASPAAAKGNPFEKGNGKSLSASSTVDSTISALEERLQYLAVQREQLRSAEEKLQVAIDALREVEG